MHGGGGGVRIFDPPNGRSRRSGAARNAELTIAAEKALPAHHAAVLSPSYLDLGAGFDDPVRRDAEEIGRPRRNAREAGIKALAPPRHPGPWARFDVGASNEEGELGRIEFQPRDVRRAQLPRYVRRLGWKTAWKSDPALGVISIE